MGEIKFRPGGAQERLAGNARRASLRRAGGRRLFLDEYAGSATRDLRSENTVFGYFEADDIEAARSQISSAEVQARCAVEIDELLEPESVVVGTTPLEEVFRLD